MTQALEERLVTANRILANEGWVRAFGHVSARDPGADTMLIARSLPPKLVTADDILEMTLDGELLGEDDAGTFKENVIHRAIYRNREDVNAVIHHHARAVMPFAITGAPFRPVVPGGTLFRDGVPTFEAYDDEFGRLVVSEAEGERMAAVLGDGRAQFLKGHGANVVGSSVEAAIVNMFRFVQNADRQFTASLFGEPDYYTGPAASVAAMEELMHAEGIVERIWDFLEGELPGGR